MLAVWITKYRNPVLRGPIGDRVRELIREICRSKDVEIIRGHVSKDHVHVFVLAPPHLSVSQLVQSLKGKSSRKMMMEFKFSGNSPCVSVGMRACYRIFYWGHLHEGKEDSGQMEFEL